MPAEPIGRAAVGRDGGLGPVTSWAGASRTTVRPPRGEVEQQRQAQQDPDPKEPPRARASDGLLPAPLAQPEDGPDCSQRDAERRQEPPEQPPPADHFPLPSARHWAVMSPRSIT